jgi:hypothetical protein
MAAGLALQAIGLGWVAAIAEPGMGYAQLSVALTVAGIGTSMCFPTVANAVMGSVPSQEAGVASGANSAIRELGGVFGVAVLAAVFTGPGVYGSPQSFVEAFKPALWVGAVLAVFGIVSALLAPRHTRAPAELPTDGPVQGTGAGHAAAAGRADGGADEPGGATSAPVPAAHTPQPVPQPVRKDG